ncbi:MAG: hypothetical protein A3J48_02570 [Candidatus Doudnabacteria bacterium RIFCSPHIGHO2_02_FULL_46_11]|uniref:Uncharacterized protein n=1 Tax=Candidatus Doudnabacteria bacterium RIFCSPHIGHO2_02_FULL_46_11 TaxID=1817832 RepID=A0A1F5P8U3_9BACT|nr:MAG: hypothetical protein A3J48_02570 [Candidatus Doudnabacteria bacterium RIFCSPHIGHO2_02_FULL_46_11]
MNKILEKFWNWYERHYTLNVGISAFLFLLQLVHLYWLSTHVVVLRVSNRSFFDPGNFWELIILLVDYTEIPALISTSILYIHSFKKNKNSKDLLYLFFINSQWLHIFWITDEFVVEKFTDPRSSFLPVWLAWVALVIDYLELPVIYDTLKRFFRILFNRSKF